MSSTCSFQTGKINAVNCWKKSTASNKSVLGTVTEEHCFKWCSTNNIQNCPWLTYSCTELQSWRMEDSKRKPLRVPTKFCRIIPPSFQQKHSKTLKQMHKATTSHKGLFQIAWQVQIYNWNPQWWLPPVADLTLLKSGPYYKLEKSQHLVCLHKRYKHDEVHTWLDWQTSKTVNPEKPHIPNLHTVFGGIKPVLIVLGIGRTYNSLLADWAESDL